MGGLGCTEIHHVSATVVEVAGCSEVGCCFSIPLNCC